MRSPNWQLSNSKRTCVPFLRFFFDPKRLLPYETGAWTVALMCLRAGVLRQWSGALLNVIIKVLVMPSCRRSDSQVHCRTRGSLRMMLFRYPLCGYFGSGASTT